MHINVRCARRAATRMIEQYSQHANAKVERFFKWYRSKIARFVPTLSTSAFRISLRDTLPKIASEPSKRINPREIFAAFVASLI